MGLNNSQQAIIDNRRRQVAALRLRGLTQREIASALAEKGLVNPESQEAWSLGTVNSDIKAMEADWRQEAAGDIADHKARQFAELREVKRAAWGLKDLPVILRALKQEAELLGTDAPDKSANVNIDVSQLNEDQLVRIANGEDPLHVLATKSGG